MMFLAEIFIANRQGKARHYRLVKAATHDAALREVATYCETTWPTHSNEWSFVIHPTIGDTK